MVPIGWLKILVIHTQGFRAKTLHPVEICGWIWRNRVDQLPIFPYNRGWETQPNSRGLYTHYQDSL